MFASLGDIFVQQRLHAVGAQLAAVHVREESRCTPLPGLVEPAPKGLLCNLGERRTSLLAALANASHVGTVPQHHRVPVEIDDLRDPQPRLRGQQQQSVITPSQPCAAIRTGQDRFNLGPGEKLKLSLVASLARDREQALNLGAMGRLAIVAMSSARGRRRWFNLES